MASVQQRDAMLLTSSFSATYSLTDKSIGFCYPYLHFRMVSKIFAGYLDKILNRLVLMPFS